MNNLNRRIEDHYYRESLYEEILNRLKKQQTDLDQVSRNDISGVDEFHVRGSAVSKELASSLGLRGMRVLDVGCGLGGPCRMLADEFGCTVVGIDLSHEFVRTATALSRLVKLDDRTSFVQGDATELPFEDGTFDAVWTQHVQMNIPDKKRFYSEIHRVLKPGGHFLYYDIFCSNGHQVLYPMPWAEDETFSFLFRKEEMADILGQTGMSRISSTDQTKAGIGFFEMLVARLKEHGPPNLGLNVLMGESTKQKLTNLLTHLQDSRLILESGIYRKG